MKVAVTGASGLIGSALVGHLRGRGNEVMRVVRTSPGKGDVVWDPAAGSIDVDALNGVDAVVHLAGAGVGDHRWSADYKEEILQSRVRGTHALATALAGLARPPGVFLSASAVGFYGVRGDEVLTEDSGNGDGFLADVCRRWEAATAPATGAGIRTVVMRNGIVLSATGGALKKQLWPFRLGLGARLGSGRQYFSWISRRDVVAAISFLIAHPEISGPLNLTTPAPVTNTEFTRALGRAVRRPTLLAVPSAALRLAVGREMAEEFLLASQRVMPQRLTEAGFVFADPLLDGGLRTALDDRPHDPLVT
ncbi:MAG TPA: TIGR01777 family oxidoreductase [Acidimicrobiales bacterium]|jgi:hypothetical protein|nr:TIGR01777 family oxidoreductase [Acidimicrobiales bacterium]